MKNSIHCPIFVLNIFRHSLCRSLPLFFAAYNMQKELDRTGVPLEKVLERYHLADITQMTAEQYRDAMTGLKRSQSRTAA